MGYVVPVYASSLDFGLVGVVTYILSMRMDEGSEKDNWREREYGRGRVTIDGAADANGRSGERSA